MKAALKFIKFIFLFVLIQSGQLYARVGGAGGGSSSGGSSSSHHGGGGGRGGKIEMSPLVLTILLCLAAVFLFFLIRFVVKGHRESILYKILLGDKKSSGANLDKLKKNNPDFHEETFISYAEKAFYAMQENWTAKTLKNARLFMTDGMYQRLNTQLIMMEKLGQTNELSDIKVISIRIDDAESDGPMDIIHVEITASITDKFVSPKYPQFNSGGKERFSEYWSFIKKRGSSERDIYAIHDCPNCGSPLSSEKTDICRCEYCKALINSGEYGWVLSEISQYSYYNSNKYFTENFNLNILFGNKEDICFQEVEDKVSNAFFHIAIARVFKNPILARRFVSDEYYKSLCNLIENEKPMTYARIYTNSVNTIDGAEMEGKNKLIVEVSYSNQRIIENKEKSEKIDKEILYDNSYFIMSRSENAMQPKGSLYNYECPSCGGPLKETSDVKCQYCQAIINSPDFEWIVEDVMDVYEYSKYKAKLKEQNTEINIDAKNEIAKEYALNNMLVIMGSDGVFLDDEIKYIFSLSKKWKLKYKDLKALCTMAMNKELTIRMPEDKQERQKVFKLMENAAYSDRELTESEKEILAKVEAEYLAK